MLERIQRRTTKTIPELRDLCYEERLTKCGLTTLETRRLRLKFLRYGMKILIKIFFSHSRQ